MAIAIAMREKIVSLNVGCTKISPLLRHGRFTNRDFALLNEIAGTGPAMTLEFIG
jgi:hypothetical protein